MVLKKKVTAAVLAGVLATAAVVPMGLTASAKSQGNVDVQYIAGALVPDGSDGSYYVTIPSNVTFTGAQDAKNMNVQLHRTDVNKTLNPDLEVTVDVYSKNNYILKNAGFSQTGVYELVYTGTGATNADTALANKTPAGPASADAGAEVGVLTPDANKNVTTNQKSLVGEITGKATLKTEPTVDVPGTPFTDTLTYYVTQTVPTVQP